MLDELLDLVDCRRFDSHAIVDNANNFDTLSDEERSGHLGPWEYATLDEAAHALTDLLRESHNDTCVVRDLDGTLKMMWEDHSRSGRWLIGQLFRESLIRDEEITDLLEAEPDWLNIHCLNLTSDQLFELLNSLPAAPGPVMRF